jgi:hypothetical protein
LMPQTHLALMRCSCPAAAGCQPRPASNCPRHACSASCCPSRCLKQILSPHLQPHQLLSALITQPPPRRRHLPHTLQYTGYTVHDSQALDASNPPGSDAM